MHGLLYGIGVGPGDPELLTVKAIRAIKAADIIAVPDSGTGEQVALDITREYVDDKPVLSLYLPMTRDDSELARCRKAAAEQIIDCLERGQTVAFLTLGDTTIYATYTYLHKLVVEQGYTAQMIPGIPSFCAAAAALNIPLCETGQALHILPASYVQTEHLLDLDGVKVFMKSGKKLGALLEQLEQRDLLDCSYLAERVSMPQQRLVHHLTATEQSGYFSVVITHPKNQ